jgi:hypothetical protein
MVTIPSKISLPLQNGTFLGGRINRVSLAEHFPEQIHPPTTRLWSPIATPAETSGPPGQL